MPQSRPPRHRFDDQAAVCEPGWVEVELKFDVEADDAWRVLETLAPGEPVARRTLRTIYFDTPDAALRRNGLVLRIRDNGLNKVQAVKSRGPGGVFQRGEWETEVKSLAPDFAALAATPLAAVWAAKVRPLLKPAFEVNLERASRLVAVDQSIIEVVFDQGEVRLGDQASPVCEVELELKSGPLDGLLSLARRLSSEAALDLSFTTKAERGYGLFRGEPGSKAPLDPKTPTADAFAVIAVAALGQMVSSARDLRREPDARAVHRLRVGARRLRSALSLFGSMPADERRGAIKTELKWLGGELNEARDLDVLIEDAYGPYAAGRPDAPGLAALGHDLNAARETAYRRVVRAVSSARFRALMLEVALWVEFGAWREDPRPRRAKARVRPIRKTAATIIDRRLDKMIKGAAPPKALSSKARHRLRIAVKKLRYACEFFEGLEQGHKEKARARLAHDLTALQDALGVLNDIATTRKLDAKIKGLTGLIDADKARETQALKTATKLWRRLA